MQLDCNTRLPLADYLYQYWGLTLILHYSRLYSSIALYGGYHGEIQSVLYYQMC
jgi:hypothetical protein